MAKGRAVWRVVGAVAGLGLGASTALLAGPARATTLAPGNSITFGAYTVEVNSCSIALCDTAEMSAVGSGGFVITGAGGSTLLDTSSAIEDLSVTFEVTTATPILNKVVLQAAGGNTGTGLAKVDENAFDSSFSGIGFGTAFAGGASTTISFALGPYDDIFLTKDISANPGEDGTATIDSVTQLFAVPEPASIGVLGMGLMALLVRKRRRS